MTNEYGPQTVQINAFLRTLAVLDIDSIDELSAAWVAAGDAAWVAAGDAAWVAARGAARDVARFAARDAAWDAARGAAWFAAWGAARDAAGGAAWFAAWAAAAVRDAAVALVVRDLIGQYGFTQEHYDTLTRPWRKTVGKLHEDDEELK